MILFLLLTRSYTPILLKNAENPLLFSTGHSVACYICSLALLTPLTRSAAQRFATLALLSLFTGSLSLGMVEFICSHCKLVQSKETRFWSSLETPSSSSFHLASEILGYIYIGYTRTWLSNNGLFFSEAQCCYLKDDMRLKPLLNCCYFFFINLLI